MSGHADTAPAPTGSGFSVAPLFLVALAALCWVAGGWTGIAGIPLLLPLAAAGLLGWLGAGLRGRSAGWTAVTAAVLSFAAAVALLFHLLGQPPEERALHFDFYRWLDLGGLSLTVGVLLDPLSATWALVVTGVGSLIFVYSVAYMEGDRSYARYFSYLSLFLFSMMILVLGRSLPLTFLGWEGVGLCSYLLIGFEYEKDTAANAGRKAFLVNRIGDVGFLLAMFWTFRLFGTLDLSGLLEGVDGVAAVPAWLALCFFLGAVGKSAQAPLFVWLPDAMAGPTPVSALIHAATMVTAGVYLLCRLGALFVKAGWALSVVAWMGVLTALLAGVIALRQRDIKRVLAYSTISQLGYMFLACGVGAFGAAVFHVTTHAFFKALLFLGSGAVIHALDGEQDLWKMGGLRHQLPRTYRAMWFGALALAGIAPFAGFFSKDEILGGAFGHGAYLLWGVGVVTAALTAFYTSRMMTLCFLGESRLEEGKHPHEAPPLMAVPLSILKWLSLLGGLLLSVEVAHWTPLHHWLEPVLPPLEAHLGRGVMSLLLVLAFGIAVGCWLLGKRSYKGEGLLPRQLLAAFPRLSRAVLERFWVDEIYQRGIVAPLRALARLCGRFDLGVVDGLYTLVANVVGFVGNGVRLLQTGVVHAYLFWFLVGAAALLALVGRG